MIINNTLQDIATLLLEHSVEHREELLFEELDRATMYYHACWAILDEERPTSFFIDGIGQHATGPDNLAWSILYDRFMLEYGILLDA